MSQAIRWGLVMAGALFVFGCAPPPVSPTVPKADSPSTVATQKKKSKKPSAQKKKKKSGQKKHSTAPEMTTDMAKPGLDANGSQDQEAEQELILGRTMFHYDYYPDVEVYFDTIRHLYFYQDGGSWAMSVALPISFQENLGSSVRLKMKSSKPYLSHREHRQEYPSGTGGRDF